MTHTALLALALAACSSPRPPDRTPPSGSGSGSVARTCDAQRAKLEQLYRAEALEREPKRVDDYVADNTAMVLADCARQPDRAIGCIERAASIAEIERTCVIALDEEGSEGLEHRK
jgi:hypothetical protein